MFSLLGAVQLSRFRYIKKGEGHIGLSEPLNIFFVQGRKDLPGQAQIAVLESGSPKKKKKMEGE